MRPPRFAALPPRLRASSAAALVILLLAGLLPTPGAADEPDHLRKGSAAFAAGRFDEAVAEFRAAAAERPGSVEALLGLGTALARTGDANGALHAFVRATALDPSNEDALLARSDLLSLLGRYAEARTLLDDACRNHPSRGRTALGLASLLATCPDPALRDGARAVDLAERVLDGAPTATAGRVYAQALAEAGRCADAARWQERVLAAARKEPPPFPTSVLEDELARYEKGAPCRPPTGPKK